MKILSWNLNGIRAVHKRGQLLPIYAPDMDILCFQETKAEAVQVPAEAREIAGYTAYFSHSRMKKGYSGVAIYTKHEPISVHEGMGVHEFDQEGRLLHLTFPEFELINIYFPNGGGGPVRLAYKLGFYDAFLSYINTLTKKGKKVLFCGDVNTAHEAIDLARPKENEENTGFLPEERAWIDEVVAHGYTDVFRHFNPTKEKVYTYWDQKTGARERNVGWRIDYFFVHTALLPQVKSFETLTNVYGSDHCPIVINIKDISYPQ